MSETKSKKEEVKQEELTPEEYAEARKNAITHLKKEIEYLKVQKEYEVLTAEIEEAKTKAIALIAQRAQYFAQQNVAQNPPEGSPEPPANQPVPEGPKKRQLKKT